MQTCRTICLSNASFGQTVPVLDKLLLQRPSEYPSTLPLVQQRQCTKETQMLPLISARMQVSLLTVTHPPPGVANFSRCGSNGESLEAVVAGIKHRKTLLNYSCCISHTHKSGITHQGPSRGSLSIRWV